MAGLKLTQFKVLTFDCYGTLIDWEKGLIEALKKTKVYGLRQDGELLSIMSALESPIQSANPTWLYPKILKLVLIQLANNVGLKEDLSQEEITEFGASIGNWPPFPDTIEALKYLQQNYKLVILSNVDKNSFAKTEELLGIKFDLIVTAEDVGSYKPTLANFNYVLEAIKDKWGYEKEQVLHTFQSLFHDAAPANVLGIHTAHINRASEFLHGSMTPQTESPLELDFIFPTLGDFVEAYKKDKRGTVMEV